MKQFPHLDDTAYPYLDTVNPHRMRVDFDYGRYDYTATLKLCRVPWASDYKHVVAWEGETDRDRFFDELEGEAISLENGFVHVQTDSVRVPVPLDVVQTYNYVFLRVPQITRDQPIDYEAVPGVRVICAWIREAIYRAPSTTELVLEVDYWSTYLPHLVPTIVMLHRGHAPAYAVSTDEYLDNPRENSSLLLTPDVSFGSSDFVASSRLVDVASGAKVLVLASTIPYTDITGLTLSGSSSGSSTPASYYDTGSRDGYQVGVSGYEWHYGGRTYANMRNPSSYSGQGDAVPTYAYLYAIKGPDVPSALTTLADRLPQLIMSVQVAYVMPEKALRISGSLTVAGVRLYRVEPDTTMQKLASLKLDASAFSYPTRYAKIAKLYTSPYAYLVVSDTQGQDIVMRIEDLGSDPHLVQQISPVAECLRWDVLVTGANDAGDNEYAWVDLAGHTRELTLPGTDLARHTIELGIPTYALYLDARTATAARDYNNALSQRASAINAYQSSMRSANTGKANTDASADTTVTNTANSGRNSQANATIANNLRTTSTARGNTANYNLTEDSAQNIYDSSNADLEYSESATDVSLKSEAVASITNLVGNALAGNVAGVLNTGVSGIINLTTKESLAELSWRNILDHQGISQRHLRNGNSLQAANATDQAGYQNTANTNTTNNNVTTANTNASNSAATSKSNAGHSRGTSETNAKAALELARLNYERQGHAHDMANPEAYGSASGNPASDALMRRVVQVRVETQSPGAIARAGDAMLRYGYTYDGLWIVSDWAPQGHAGCYWEASDVLFDASAIDSNEAARMYETVLMSGVTVWSDPSKIGGLPWV